MRKILVVCFGLCYSFGFCQDQLIHGKIVTNDFYETTIHVLNKSQDLGVLSNEDRSFMIQAKVSDTLMFSSISYTTKTYIIQQKDFNTEILIAMEESINELETVTLFQYGLSGNLAIDARKIPQNTRQLPHYNAAELKKMRISRPDDEQSPVENEVLPAQNQNMLDLMPLIKALIGLFKKKKDQEEPLDIKELFDVGFFTKNLEIPETRYYEFMDYLEAENKLQKILETRDELKILEFLLVQQEIFLQE